MNRKFVKTKTQVHVKRDVSIAVLNAGFYHHLKLVNAQIYLRDSHVKIIAQKVLAKVRNQNATRRLAPVNAAKRNQAFSAISNARRAVMN